MGHTDFRTDTRREVLGMKDIHTTTGVVMVRKKW